MDFQLAIEEIKKLTGAKSIRDVQRIESLWSGYGEIFRSTLMPQKVTVVVKYVRPPDAKRHKYGWSGGGSHQRKLDSYNNELSWYRVAASHLTADCRIADFLAGSNAEDLSRWIFVFEDLDAAGFPIRRSNVNERQLVSCLRWLAGLHASFLVDSAQEDAKCSAEVFGLSRVGTYWHLATRPDELAAMPASELKSAASEIDFVLNRARFQTLVHGDAKLANFCFSESDRVAAVDFQYVGGGCGIKDVAYFVSSCFGEAECERNEARILDIYFQALREFLKHQHLSPSTVEAVESEWRSLYPFAWADFYRFLVGWSPGHRKIHRYSERMAAEVIASL